MLIIGSQKLKRSLYNSKSTASLVKIGKNVRNTMDGSMLRQAKAKGRVLKIKSLHCDYFFQKKEF